MINGNLSQFLDTGWWNADATIYYKDHIYFLDGAFNDKHQMQLSIRKWRAKNIDNKIYENVLDSNGNLIDYKEFKIEAATEEALREKFLKAKIWDGKSFWEVEKEKVTPNLDQIS